jgi:hypothetical protein
MLATGFLSAQKSHHSLQSKEQATKAAEFDKLQVSRLRFDAQTKNHRAFLCRQPDHGAGGEVL